MTSCRREEGGWEGGGVFASMLKDTQKNMMERGGGGVKKCPKIA